MCIRDSDRIITIPYAKENAVSEGADYPLPVLSSLLPEGIVPVDKNGKPWPKDPTGTNWVNADLDFDITVRQASTLQDGNANKVVTTADQPENLPTKANYREMCIRDRKEPDAATDLKNTESDSATAVSYTHLYTVPVPISVLQPELWITM